MVALDRPFLWRWVVVALIFAWPLILFGRPAYFPDSAVYYNGGATAVRFVESHVGRDGEQAAGPSGASAPREAAGTKEQEPKGARSILYSVAAFILSGPGVSLTALAALQVVVTAFCVTACLFATSLERSPLFWGGVALLAFATPAAWFASFAMPDILAGVTVLSLGLLAAAPSPLSLGVRILLLLAGAGAIAAHASHLALAFVLLGAILIAALIARARMPWWCVATVALGGLATVASGYIGFGEISVAPKRYPLALARAIEEGPARAYLEAACPTRHYQICDLYPGGLPYRASDLLWGPDGLSVRATPQQMERIRNEEQAILIASTRARPARAAGAAATGFFQQLVRFDLGEADFGLRTHALSPGRIDLARGPTPYPGLKRVIEYLSCFTAAGAAILILAALARRSGGRLAGFVVLVVLGVLANAAICATFSAVANRYQARVVWLLPLCALMPWAARSRWRDRERPW